MTTERAESRPYQLFMLTVSLLAIVAIAAEAATTLDAETQRILQVADVAACTMFFADFLRCLWRAENRWRYFYTWGWLDLLASIPAVEIGRWGRLARVMRILKVLRAIRAARVLADAVLRQRRESAFFAAALVALLVMVVASISILKVETAPESNIRNAEDALWWSITTMSTVGYGDRYPVTLEGRLVAVGLMCSGVCLFGVLTGILASWFVAPVPSGAEDEVISLRQEVQRLRQALGPGADSPLKSRVEERAINSP